MELHPRVHVQEVGNETALVQFETGLFFGLNEVGAEILNMLKQGYSQEDIAKTISSNYEIPEEEAATDLNTFLAELAKAKILKP